MRVVNNNGPWETARKLDEAIQRLKWTVRGCAVNARAEQSAMRKKAWCIYYQRLQNIKDTVGESNVEGCARNMAVYSIPACIMVGQLRNPNKHPDRIWNEPGCREVGLTAE